MKLSKIGPILALIVILTLLVPLSATPVHATGEYIFIYPNEGKIGDHFEVLGSNYNGNDIVNIYISSTRAEKGDEIGDKVTAYEQILIAYTDAEGFFDRTYAFFLPDALNDGEDIEDVHGGAYYIYATYYRSSYIVAIATFNVIGGEISLDTEEGTVGTEVEISGQSLRSNQQITINYDGDDIDIAAGDIQTDKNGDFTCTIIIPESSAGSHIISALDESGNTPEAEFTVTPLITINPTEQITGGNVQISGMGFAKRGAITITIDGEEVETTPPLPNTDHDGNFEGIFLVPFSGSYGTRTVKASDDSSNEAEAQLAIQGGITVSPTTNPASPGHAGMELIILGAGFTDGAMVTVTYSNDDETIPVATVAADGGTILLEFIVPPSLAESHDITATDGTSTATAAFLMESKAPPTPTPLTPKVAGTTGAAAYFDWSDVSDDSGVSYTLQLAVDVDFNAVFLEKVGLVASEYTLTEEEKLEPIEKEDAYYWRVKTVDGASNESSWTHPGLFYVGFSLSSVPAWAFYVLGVVAATVLVILGYWLLKKRVKGKRTI